MNRTLIGSIALMLTAVPPLPAQGTPDSLRAAAQAYYAWRNQQYPVGSSDQGLHTWDSRLADFAPAAITARRTYVRDLLARVKGWPTTGWSKDDRVDWLLFRAQLERVAFWDRELKFEETNPQLYVNECANAVFSLLKKEYAPPRTRALAATARFRAMPALLLQARTNLTEPVRLYAELAADGARSMDPLFVQSTAPLAAALTGRDRRAFEAARDSALAAVHAFAAWLESGFARMPAFRPMGVERYEYLLHNVYLLPYDARQIAMLGEIEAARARALEALLPDPSLASPDPRRAARIPADQADFLRAYESRQKEMVDFLGAKRLVTIPAYVGPFYIRQLPEAFRPTSPGGFMNPPGLYDADNSGFYFIPTYDAASENFYIRAAIEDPRPILGHEGVPGHFLQISIANHLTNEIRREHGDGVFVEGWALYTEQMLTEEGLYPEGSAARGQVLRLTRYRGARIGVDVNLHSGRWSFDEAVRYFQDAGGLDRTAATGEAAGAASDPTQKITYIVGKYQIMRLLGRWRDAHPSDYRLGAFHDALLAQGSLPLSVVEWLLLDDPTTLAQALGVAPESLR